MDFVSFISTRVLSSDARICAPPGEIAVSGQRNIIVATPMRSGTHIAMDMVLNSLPRYRRYPLYINLDAFLVRGHDKRMAEPEGLLNAGYVIKTHFPSGRVAGFRDEMAALARQSLVVVVNRPEAEIRKSLERWAATKPGMSRIQNQLTNLDAELAAFHAFWGEFSPYQITFRDLFDPARCQTIVADIARLTNHPEPYRKVPAPPVSRPMLVYVNKALTRTLGRHAPRIDTSIQALR
jgi:hypothetical protein